MSSGSPILLKILSANQFSGKTNFYTIASRSQGQHRDALRRTVRPARLPERVAAEEALHGTANAERLDGDAVPLGRRLLHEM